MTLGDFLFAIIPTLERTGAGVSDVPKVSRTIHGTTSFCSLFLDFLTYDDENFGNNLRVLNR
jgi:hypothetical protein